MISQLTVISANVNNKPFNLLLSPGSTYEELKEAMFQISKIIAKSEDETKAEAEKQKSVAVESSETEEPSVEQ